MEAGARTRAGDARCGGAGGQACRRGWRLLMGWLVCCACALASSLPTLATTMLRAQDGAAQEPASSTAHGRASPDPRTAGAAKAAAAAVRQAVGSGSAKAHAPATGAAGPGSGPAAPAPSAAAVGGGGTGGGPDLVARLQIENQVLQRQLETMMHKYSELGQSHKVRGRTGTDTSC